MWTPLLLLAAASPVDQDNGLRGSICPIGDVDEDGAGDFVLARRGWGPVETFVAPGPEYGGPGIAWIVSSKGGDVLHTLEPKAADARFGRLIEAAGDLDGDGKGDVWIGGSSQVWAYSGTGEMLRGLKPPTHAHSFGQAFASGGDRDGDGVPDLAVYYTTKGVAHAALYSGKSGDLLDSVEVPAGQPALSLVSDLDGDDHADLAMIVGADEEHETAGLVVIGSKGERVLRGALPRKDSFHPWGVRDVGDVNEDGKVDLAASLINERVSVFSGADGSLLFDHNYAGGYMEGEGAMVEAGFDLDGDGVPDYLITGNEDGFDCDPGFVAVISGKTGEALRSIDYRYDNGNCGPGVDACAVGDVNGDGTVDFAFHVPRHRQVQVVSGKDFAVALTAVELREAPFLVK